MSGPIIGGRNSLSRHIRCASLRKAIAPGGSNAVPDRRQPVSCGVRMLGLPVRMRHAKARGPPRREDNTIIPAAARPQHSLPLSFRVSVARRSCP